MCSFLYEQFEIKIPLVKLSFASKTGLKRIPKKRPAERDTSECLMTTVFICMVYNSGVHIA